MFVKYFGALTLKNYAFQSRPWELITIESFDLTSALGSSILFELRGGLLRRVLPRFKSWISNMTRLGFDGLTLNRLSMPFLGVFSPFTFLNTCLPVSWLFLFQFLITYFVILHKKFRIFGSAKTLISFGSFSSLDQIFFAKYFFSFTLGSFISSNDFGLDCDFRSNFLQKSLYNQLFSASRYLIVSVHPRLELPLIFSLVRKSIRNNIVRSFINKLPEKNQKLLFSFCTRLDGLNDHLFFGGMLNSFFHYLQGKHSFCRFSNYATFCFIGSSLFYSKTFKLTSSFFFFFSKKLSFDFFFFFIPFAINLLNIFEINVNLFSSNFNIARNKVTFVPQLVLDYMSSFSNSSSLFLGINLKNLFLLIFSQFFYFFYNDTTSSFFCEILLFFTLVSNSNIFNVFFNLNFISFFFKYFFLQNQLNLFHSIRIFQGSHLWHRFLSNNFTVLVPVRGFGELSFNYLSAEFTLKILRVFRKGIRLSLNDQSIFFSLFLVFSYFCTKFGLNVYRFFIFITLFTRNIGLNFFEYKFNFNLQFHYLSFSTNYFNNSYFIFSNLRFVRNLDLFFKTQFLKLIYNLQDYFSISHQYL